MNRSKIDAYIAELLKSRDCVIVPEFGGFVGNYAKAKINPVSNRFDPPFRKVSFNKLLTHNDGLLASFVAQKEQEKFESSLSRLKDYTIVLKDELDKTKKIQFENIGVLHQKSDGTFQFEQLKDSTFFEVGFGLESFFANQVNTVVKVQPSIEPKTIKEEVVMPAPVAVKLFPTVEALPAPEKKHRLWPAIAATLALPILGYAIWISLSTPLFKDTDSFHYSDLNPFTEKICPEYESRIHFIETIEETESLELIIDPEAKFIEIFEPESRDKTLVVSLEEKLENAPSIQRQFHVIGGCFSDISNAQGLTQKYIQKGNFASIVEQKGHLYRVSVASFITRSEALDALNSLRNEIPNAWILYK